MKSILRAFTFVFLTAAVATADDVKVNPDGSFTVIEDDGTKVIGNRKGFLSIFERDEEVHINRSGVRVKDYDKKVVIKDLGVRSVDGNYLVDLSGDVLFDFDKSNITPQAAEKLDKVAYLIKEDRKGLVIIRGHTDAKGSDGYNMNLSKERADSVANWLMSLTNEKSDVYRVQGLGENYPTATNESDTGRAQNRRVEIIIQQRRDAAIPSAQTVYMTSGNGNVAVTNGAGSVEAHGRNNNSFKADNGSLKAKSTRGNTIDTENGNLIIRKKGGGSVRIPGF